MRLLQRAGEIAVPRGASELRGILEGSLTGPATYSVEGNMAYWTSRAEQ